MIPLGPLRLADMFNGAFSTMGRYWKQLFGFAAAVYGAAALVVGATLLIAFSAVRDNLDRLDEAYSAHLDTVDWDDVVPIFVALGIVALVGLVVSLVAMALVQAAVPVVLQEAVLGRPVTFGAVRARATARMGAMLGTGLLTGLIAAVPVLLVMACYVTVFAVLLSNTDMGAAAMGILVVALILITVGALSVWFWLWGKFSLAPTAVVLEGQGPVDALRRSSRLVRGAWMRVVGVSLLGYLVAGVASYFIQLPFSVVGVFSTSLTAAGGVGPDPSVGEILVPVAGLFVTALVGQLVGQIFVGTFPPLLVGMVYIDRRIRTENLAQDLIAAAGLTAQTYAPPPPPYGYPGSSYGYPGGPVPQQPYGPGPAPQPGPPSPPPQPTPPPQPEPPQPPHEDPGATGKSAP